jgi:hypothetical protein
MSEDDDELKKIIIPSFMKALCKLDDEVNRGKRIGNNTFTMTEVHQEAVLHSFTPDTVARIVRGYAQDYGLIDVDKDDKVTLTQKGLTWCSDPDEAELFLVQE